MTQDNPTPPPPFESGSTSPPPPPPPAVGYETPASIEMNKEARTWGMVAHLSALIGLTGIPSVVGPLIVWLIKKDQIPFVNDQGKEALNFNITVFLAALVCIPLFCVGIGFIGLIVVVVGGLVFSIIAAIKANEGVAYRYPVTLRLIK